MPLRSSGVGAVRRNRRSSRSSRGTACNAASSRVRLCSVARAAVATASARFRRLGVSCSLISWRTSPQYAATSHGSHGVRLVRSFCRGGRVVMSSAAATGAWSLFSCRRCVVPRPNDRVQDLCVVALVPMLPCWRARCRRSGARHFEELPQQVRKPASCRLAPHARFVVATDDEDRHAPELLRQARG